MTYLRAISRPNTAPVAIFLRRRLSRPPKRSSEIQYGVSILSDYLTIHFELKREQILLRLEVLSRDKSLSLNQIFVHVEWIIYIFYVTSDTLLTTTIYAYLEIKLSSQRIICDSSNFINLSSSTIDRVDSQEREIVRQWRRDLHKSCYFNKLRVRRALSSTTSNMSSSIDYVVAFSISFSHKISSHYNLYRAIILSWTYIAK